MFLMYVDETGDRWIYCPSEELKDEFHGDGISSKKTDKMMSTATTLTHPTPRKSSPGDCNFVVAKLDPAAIPTDIADIDIEVISKEDFDMEGVQVLATGAPVPESIESEEEATPIVEVQMIPEPETVVMSQTNEGESISYPVPDEMAAKDNIEGEEATPTVDVKIPGGNLVPDEEITAKEIVESEDATSIVDIQMMPEPEKVVKHKSQPTNEDASIPDIVTPSRTYTSKLDKTSKRKEPYVSKISKSSQHAEPTTSNASSSSKSKDASSRFPGSKKRLIARFAKMAEQKQSKTEITKRGRKSSRKTQSKKDTDFIDASVICFVCDESYNRSKDNIAHGRWMECEMQCGIWCHGSCVGFSNSDIDTVDFYCPNCEK